MRVSSAPEDDNSRIEITLGVESLTAEVTIAADVGVVQSLDQTTQQVNVIDETPPARARQIRPRASCAGRAGAAIATHVGDHGRHLRPRADRRQGRQLR